MKVIGKFKDELHGCAMTKFVGLRPKLYSYEYEEKGVNTKVKNTKLIFADYEHSPRMLNVNNVSMNTIRSDHHKFYSLSTKKIGLSAFNDKRYICADGISTPAHRHLRVL